MPKRRLYSEPLKKKSDNATLFYLKGRQVDPRWIRYITFSTAYSESQSNRDIEFGKLVGDTFYSFEGTDSSKEDIPTWFTRKTHHFTAGEIPAFRFTNAEVDTSLVGYLEGYEVESREVVTVD